MAAISVKRSVGAMKGACNPNLQVAITCTYGWHIHGASFSKVGLPLRMDGMHRMQI